ncbi:MAG TPA: FG-GAP-like repeat-containing protein [Cyclobacteriaceae bacterium]|nr:FG-GAP-like repeat-containing protein [Cyclobacteriaceae bacterium]
MMKKVIVPLLLSCTLQVSAQITSTFDTDADGWTFLNSATPVTVTHQPANGNPGGFASVTYSSNVNLTTQHWIAPSKFLGSHLVRSLGMQLKFNLQQSIAGVGAGYDVRIESGGTFIYLSGIPKPAVAPAWTSYSFTLDETGGWYYSAGAIVATRAHIKSILSNVTSIEIRGTYGTNGAYISGLDNVILEQRTLTAAPIASSLSATSGMPGDIITINGSGFDPDKTLNTVSFGAFAGIKGEVQSATATQLTIVVPQGATYGPIAITNNTTGLTSKTSTPFSPVFQGGGRIIPASFESRFTIATIQNEGWFVGDFDGDGWEDLAITNNNADDVIDIYRNLALGGDLSSASFAAKVTISAPQLGGSGTNGAGLWFADLDGDGKTDAITSNSLSPFAAAFITLRNTSTPGNISFELPEYWAGGSDETPPYFVGDVDGDGRPDLVGGEGSSGPGTNLWIAQNISSPGDIEFGSSVGYFSATVDGLSEVAMGDLNNDGKPDMIASWFFGDRFSIIQNNSAQGVISMTDVGQILTGQYNRSMKIVDVNFDGKNDLVWKRTSGGTYIRINTDTDGILTISDFATEYILTSDLATNGGIAISDFNGDGKPDIVGTDDSDVGVYESVFSGDVFDLNAYVPAYQVLGAGSNSGSPWVADLNHDGKPDLVLTSSAAFSIIESKNVVSPQISVNTVSPLTAPVGATVTITGNSFSPVAAENHVYFGAVKATVLTASATEIKVSVPAGAAYAPVSVRKGELTSRYRLPFTTVFSSGVTFNNTHFAPPVNFTFTNTNYDIDVADLNRDGKPDLLVEGTNGIIFRNTHSSGAITTSSLIPDDTLNNSFVNPRLEDFDGDGLPDAIAANGVAHKNNSSSAEINFLPVVSLAFGASTLDIADFNADGKMDMTMTADASGQNDLQILENRTANLTGNFTTGTYGSFSGIFFYTKPDAFGGVIAEDFDGDGFPDIITSNPGLDNISIYRNLGVLKISPAQFAARVDMAVADTPGRIYKGDFDHDGKVDLMVPHAGSATTTLAVLHNTSTPGNISFTRFDLTNPSATTVGTIADLDGDGKPEILTTSEGGNRISIFKNVHTSGALTTASFAAPFNITVTAPRGIATGDLNLDGKPEIIITRAAALLVVYENLIQSTFPTITSFTPGSGPTGTTVVITGTNFDPVPAGNTVTFNGITAVVSASTTTSITTTVPASATTGPIVVSVSGNTATSATDFTVTAAPVITVTQQPVPSAVCEGATASLTAVATGTTNITYQWQFSSTSGGTFSDIANGGGYSNTSTSTLSINTLGLFGAGFYRCKISGDFATAVNSDVVAVTVNAAPSKPILTSSVTPVGNTVSLCTTSPLTLSAPAGFFGYTWSNGNTTQQISVTTSGTYSFSVTSAATCVSLVSDAIVVNFSDALCSSNSAPVIASASASTFIGGKVTIDLSTLITDADNNIVPSSLAIVQQPSSGASAAITNNILELDYSGITFSGTDLITIQVCDVFNECTQRQLSIEVFDDIEVYNAVSPNGDSKNDFFFIQYIDILPATQKNTVTIYNRWGAEVFETTDYNNTDRAFKGLNKNGNELPSGTYFYKIKFTTGRDMISGYLSLKR